MVPPLVATMVLDVKGDNNVNLKVYEFGNPNGSPIVFIHGINQAHIAWNKQLGSELAEQNEVWQERKYLDMDEFKEWAAAMNRPTDGGKVIAISG